MNKPKLSRSGVPTILMNEVMSWQDWLKGRRARRQTGNRVAPEIIRRASSSSDERLRRLFAVNAARLSRKRRKRNLPDRGVDAKAAGAWLKCG
jgi:hypothetical protein